MKLYIATPAYEGKVTIPYAISLSDTVIELQKAGIGCVLNVIASGALLCLERNKLCEFFLESDCTHLLCVDSDLGWSSSSILNMISKNVDIIGGCYPNRIDGSFIFRPCKKENGSLVRDDEKQIFEAEYIPSGFVLIKREVIEEMRNDNPHLRYEPKDKSHDIRGYALFNTGIYQGEFWGEDYQFCRLARQSGFQIWIDPNIEFDHAGKRGKLQDILTTDKSLVKE